MKELKKFTDYINNAGTVCIDGRKQISVDYFIEDWEPIGIEVLGELEKLGIIEFVCDRQAIKLTSTDDKEKG